MLTPPLQFVYEIMKFNKTEKLYLASWSFIAEPLLFDYDVTITYAAYNLQIFQFDEIYAGIWISLNQ